MNIEKAIKFIQKNCKADDYFIYIWSKDSHETRFAQNTITQHIAGTNTKLGLEVAYGQRTGKASTNQLDEESLRELICTAQDMAISNEPDPEFMPSVGPQKLPKVQNLHKSTSELKAEEMVELVRKSIANAEKHKAMVSGMTEKHLQKSIIVTKNGFYGEADFSDFGHSMTIKRAENETKVSFNDKNYANFKLSKELDRLNEQLDSLSAIKSFEAQKIPVIIRPAALAELFGYLGWTLNRRQADEGFTPFTGQLGKSFFGKNFSLYSTLKDKDILAPPFGNEGLAAAETCWIKNGKLLNMPNSRYWAAETKSEPSNMFNYYVPGGETTEAEMMKMVPRGLIINRFWYIRFVDAK
ncbi:MAG TPA: metallopeptidase TldD-related protein, partial [Candidatus Cloacimonadota bacterium]|nr:metallopeptidase TldD-related protein [Candidatus Cloacimonadota bacterium]